MDFTASCLGKYCVDAGKIRCWFSLGGMALVDSIDRATKHKVATTNRSVTGPIPKFHKLLDQNESVAMNKCARALDSSKKDWLPVGGVARTPLVATVLPHLCWQKD